MKIIGLKLTHDGTVAMIEDGHLNFSAEMEKIGNRARYSPMELEPLEALIDTIPTRNTFIAIDGWKNTFVHVGAEPFEVAPYHEHDMLGAEPLDRYSFHSNLLGDYSSFHHITTHLLGAYAMSPYADKIEPCYAIVMDGGVNPRLYHINPNIRIAQAVKYVASIHELYGIIYSIMRYYWGPYKDELFITHPVNPAFEWPPGQKHIFGGYEYPGKLMAYIGGGVIKYEIAQTFFLLYQRIVKGRELKYKQDGFNEHEICRKLLPFTKDHRDIDVLASIHYALERMLLIGTMEYIPKGNNLILVGGSFLNIKWNSALRNTKHFNHIFVPPVTNDTGNAIGAAVCEQICQFSKWDLKWSVDSGPLINPVVTHPGWSCEETTPQKVAYLLSENYPIIFLNGRADIGPRSLGHRSIIMNAEHKTNALFLNKIKKREHWRPVAPVCLESMSSEIFTPGGQEPYMLFEHHVKDAWVSRVPAIIHSDGTARLQTVGSGDGILFDVLFHYYALTNIPVLCNTSANLNGCGFFSEIVSAMDWSDKNDIEHIYSAPYLYTRNVP